MKKNKIIMIPLSYMQIQEKYTPCIVSRDDAEKIIQNFFSDFSFKKIESKPFPDVHIFDFLEEKSIKIEHTRSILEKTSQHPLGDIQIFFISDVHKFTKSAGNSLLKILEDIPPRTLFLLTTHSPHEIMNTLLSRVRILSTDTAEIKIDKNTQEALSLYFSNDPLPLFKILLEKKFEKDEYEAILYSALQISLKKNIPSLSRALQKSYLDVRNTNASARDITHLVFLSHSHEHLKKN